MDKKACMRKISDKVGRDKAIELVTGAYNTELVASWLRHLEAAQAGKMGKSERRDHLGQALQRVGEVCDLSD